MAERWLSFEDLCDELHLPAAAVKRLIKSGKLVGLCHGRKQRLMTDWRYLDPSPKYKRALELQERLQARSLSIDMMEFPVITTSELAEIAGVDASHLRHLISEGRLEPFRAGRYALFTPNQVRDYLMQRERVEPLARRARCETLIRWCLATIAENAEPILTEHQVKLDDDLEFQLQKLLRQKEPARSKAVAEFWRRYKMAKSVAAIVNKKKAT